MPGPPRYGHDFRSENEKRADDALALLGQFVEIAERQNALLSSINNHLYDLAYTAKLPRLEKLEQERRPERRYTFLSLP